MVSRLFLGIPCPCTPNNVLAKLENSLQFFFHYFAFIISKKMWQLLGHVKFISPRCTVGETEGAMDSASVFFLPLLLPITL